MATGAGTDDSPLGLTISAELQSQSKESTLGIAKGLETLKPVPSGILLPARPNSTIS